MQQLIEQRIDCPYCGESQTVLVDPSESVQNYIEDCQVCCRPIIFDLDISQTGEITLSTKHENE